MDNWNYPEGLDTPNAPWNQPDVEVEDKHIEQAEKEIEDLLLMEECSNFYEWNEQAQCVLPHDHTLFAGDLLEQIEVVAEERGMRAAINLLTMEQQHDITARAQCWIDERAEELAADPSACMTAFG